MTDERIREELGDTRSQGLLRAGRVARIAYVARGGGPRVVPVGFHWDGERIYVCTATTAPKVAALRDRPEVALTIDREPGAMQSLQVRGVAEIDIVDGIPDQYLAASRKSMDAEQAAAFA